MNVFGTGMMSTGANGEGQRQLKPFDEAIKDTQRRIKAEIKKLSSRSGRETVASIDKAVEKLEQDRVRLQLSLAEEKALLKRISKLNADRRVIASIDSLRKELKEIESQRNATRATLYQGKRQVGPNRNPAEVARKVSDLKGGAPVTEAMVQYIHVRIPPERIGLFVGKNGSKLNQLEEKYSVVLDLEGDDGVVQIAGITEDIAACKQVVMKFAAEEIEHFPLSPAQMRVLKCNKGNYLKSIESVLGISLVILQFGDKADGPVLKMRGCPDALVRAKRTIHDIAACSERIDLQSDGALMRLLLSDSGALLRALESEFTASLRIDRGGNAGKTVPAVEVSGSERQVGLVAARLRELVLKVEEETEDIELKSSDEVSAVIGKKGATINRIRAETGVKISVHGKKHVITLRAPRDKIPAARAAIQQALDEYALQNVVLEVPDHFDGLLFGAAGRAATKELTQKHAPSTIMVQRRELRENGVIKIFIRGPEDGVAACVAGINQLIDAQTKATFHVPKEAKTAVIGPKGSVVSKIQAETGAIINLTDTATTDTSDSTVSVHGTNEQVAAARQEIEAIVSAFAKENKTLFLLSTSVGSIIGKNGAKLKKIREQSGAQIDVVSKDNKAGGKQQQESGRADKYGTIVPLVSIHIRGTEDALAAASAALCEAAGSALVKAEDRDSFREKRIDIPSAEASKKLVGRGGETIMALEKDLGVRINILRKSMSVCISGRADANMLKAAEQVENLLQDGVVTKSVLDDVGDLLWKTLSDPGSCSRLVDSLGLVSINIESAEAVAVEAAAKAAEDLFSSYNPTKPPDNKPKHIGRVTIEGPKGAVRIAKAKLAEIDAGIERETMEVSAEHVAYLSAHQQTLERIRENFKMQIEIDDKNLSVRLSGKPTDLPKGRAEVLRLLRFNFANQVASVQLPSSALIAVVIGKGGKTIRKISAKCMNVNLDRDALKVNILDSDPARVSAAAAQIEALIASWNRQNQSIEIPEEAIATLIGRKGATIGAIRKTSGVQVIDLHRGSPNFVRLRGNADAVATAARMVMETIAKFERENDALILDPEHVSWVIGKGGSTIAAIENETGATLRIGKGSSVLNITGSSPDVIAAAKEAVEKIVQQRIGEEQVRAAEIEARQAKYRLELENGERLQKERQPKEPKSSRDSNNKLDNKLEFRNAVVRVGPVVGSAQAHKIQESANVGMPVEMDPALLRQRPAPNYSRKAHPVPAPVEYLPQPEKTPDEMVSGLDVLTMLLGSDANAEASEQTQGGSKLLGMLQSSDAQSTNYAQPDEQSFPSYFESAPAPAFHAKPIFQLSATSASVPFSPPPRPIPELLSPADLLAMGKKALDQGEQQEQKKPPGFHFDNAPPGFSHVAVQGTDDQQQFPPQNQSHYQGAGGYSLRLD